MELMIIITAFMTILAMISIATAIPTITSLEKPPPISNNVKYPEGLCPPAALSCSPQAGVIGSRIASCVIFVLTW
jgi:hypothetical protein